jgi:hypothetical protein
VFKKTSTASIQSHLNPIHTATSCSFTINRNIILESDVISTLQTIRIIDDVIYIYLLRA